MTHPKKNPLTTNYGSVPCLISTNTYCLKSNAETTKLFHKLTPILFVMFLMPFITVAQQAPFDFSIKHIGTQQNPASFSTISASSVFPIHKFNGTILWGGADTDYIFGGKTLSEYAPGQLYNLSIIMGGKISLNQKLSLIVMAEPSVSSDLKDLSFEDVKYNTAIRLQKNSDNTHKWSTGVGISKQFYGFQAIPFFQVTLPLTHKLTLTGALPYKPTLTLQIDKKRYCGVSLNGTSYSFRLSQNLKSRYVDIKQYELKVFLSQSALNFVRLEGSIGYALINRISMFDKNQQIPLRLFLFDFGKTRVPVIKAEGKGVCIELKASLPIKTR